MFTEDATEYYSALGDSDHGRESSSEDTFVTSPAVARAEPTNLARRDVEQGEVTPPAEPSGSKMTANVLFRYDPLANICSVIPDSSYAPLQRGQTEIACS